MSVKTRCAIYTRKSSEDGLEQDFNSLDAQREACEAYIASQKHEGWKLHPERYDDGGLSGGNMDRPALKALLADIKSGRVDRIVVYKIDRLTRSLADFAKIVDVLDAAGASFVSVTQSFNTATSMGRLTLNMLLSFAQFEREVTAERIRDKIAASKRKGLWMGGNVPLGYAPDGRTLKKVEEEAEVVRDIFAIYEACGNLRSAKKSMDEKGIRTAVRYGADGSSKGGLPFSLGHIHQMLTNPIYAGRIRHKKEVHPGQHPAIIALDDWDALQARMADGASIKRDQGTKSRKPRSLLIGKIFDETGDRLTPSHTKTSRGKRLRYYVSRRLIVGHKENEVGGWRLPAPDLEDRVGGLISAWMAMPQNRFAAVPKASPEQIAAMDDLVGTLKADLKKTLRLTERVDICPGQLTILLCAKQVSKFFNLTLEQITPEALLIKAEFQFRKRGVESKIILAGETNPRDEVLWSNITRAHRYFERIRSGMTYSEIAQAEGTSKDRVQKLTDLALLAPDVVRDVLQGTQPIGLTTEWLIRHSIPANWQEQRNLISKL